MTRALTVGFCSGAAVGIFLGVYFGHLWEAVRATSLGFGGGVGIFALAALVKYLGERIDKVSGQIKEGQRR